jgi:PIN domain nuclease of toxin-antitoxin system
MARARQRVSYLDTHVVAWLYEGLIEKLSATATRAIEQSTLLVSPMVELELQYLHEIGRLTVPSDTIFNALQEEIGLKRTDVPLDAIIAIAKILTWTRDVFDRLIVATAMVTREARLITKDTTIRQHSKVALW